MVAGGARTCINSAVERDDAKRDGDGENGFRTNSTMAAEVEQDRGDIAGDGDFENGFTLFGGRTLPGSDEHCSTSLRK